MKRRLIIRGWKAFSYRVNMESASRSSSAPSFNADAGVLSSGEGCGADPTRVLTKLASSRKLLIYQEPLH